MKWISIFVLLMICLTAKSQSTMSAQYLSMMRVYLEEKTLFKNEVDIKSLLSEINMTEKRYAEIIKSKLKGEDVELSKNEEDTLKAMTNLKKQKLQDALETLCKKHDVKVDDYLKFKSKFKSDLNFQRSMKPYVEEIISG